MPNFLSPKGRELLAIETPLYVSLLPKPGLLTYPICNPFLSEVFLYDSSYISKWVYKSNFMDESQIILKKLFGLHKILTFKEFHTNNTYACLFSHKESLMDIWYCKAESFQMFCRVDWSFDFIIFSAKNTVHKYTAQNRVRTSKAISESTENSVIMLSQKSLNDFFKDFILWLYVWVWVLCLHVCLCMCIRGALCKGFLLQDYKLLWATMWVLRIKP